MPKTLSEARALPLENPLDIAIAALSKIAGSTPEELPSGRFKLELQIIAVNALATIKRARKKAT